MGRYCILRGEKGAKNTSAYPCLDGIETTMKCNHSPGSASVPRYCGDLHVSIELGIPLVVGLLSSSAQLLEASWYMLGFNIMPYRHIASGSAVGNVGDGPCLQL
jgi:hypothetical protein